MWFIYIIRAFDNSLYTGITTDVARRFQQHTNGKGARYLRGKGPLYLVYSHYIGTKSQASCIEYAIKKLSKKEKEELIEGTLQLDLSYLEK